MAEPATDHAEGRLSMIAFAVQFGSAVRPVLPERGHLLIQRLRLREVPSVLLDAVQRCRSMLPGGGQAVVAEVSGVGQTPLRGDVVRQSVPYFGEHLALMHVRFGELVAQNDERIDFDRRMRLYPVLRRFQAVVHLTPRSLASGEAGGVGRHHDVASRQRRHDEVVEAVPDGRPSGRAVLSAQNGVMRNAVEPEVVPQ